MLNTSSIEMTFLYNAARPELVEGFERIIFSLGNLVCLDKKKGYIFYFEIYKNKQSFSSSIQQNCKNAL
jgi:hypothetical protein